jgi:hypothetical protein
MACLVQVPQGLGLGQEPVVKNMLKHVRTSLLHTATAIKCGARSIIVDVQVKY